MKKIIHFSDLHIGHKDNNKRGRKTMHGRFDQVIDNMIKVLQSTKEYIGVITGDIVDDATRSNYNLAKKCILKLEKYVHKVLLVPGNHDYRVKGKAHPDWVKKFNATFFGNANIQYPRVEVIDGIAFIGLDSMEGEIGTKGGEGRIGEKQLDRLKNVFENDNHIKNAQKVVVYLHHHIFNPIPKHRLVDAKKLKKVLMANKVDALLFGHLHVGHKWNQRIGIERSYEAGSTTKKMGGPGYHRVIDLSKDPICDFDADLHGLYAIDMDYKLYEALVDLAAGHL